MFEQADIGFLKMKVASLDKKSQEALFQYLKDLLGVEDVPATTQVDLDVEERNMTTFYTELARQLDKLCNTPLMPYHAFKKVGVYSALLELFREVDRVLLRGIEKPSLKRRQRFYQISITLLIGRTVNLNVPLSVQTVVNVNKTKFGGIFDASFPGYIRNKMLPLILDSQQQNSGVYVKPVYVKPIQRQNK